MGLKDIVKRLERQAAPEKELCPHLPPLIEHADGTTENESTHNCGRPRLRVVVGYTDGSDERTRTAAHRTFANMRQRFADVPAALLADKVAGEFHNVTSAELMERAA